MLLYDISREPLIQYRMTATAISDRRSYQKTTVTITIVAVTTLLLAISFSRVGYNPYTALSALSFMIFLVSLISLSACFVVLYRQTRDVKGKPDIVHEILHSTNRLDFALSPTPIRLFKNSLHAGDLVRVLSLEEIFSTLDHNGLLDELPFMPEMAEYCGHVYRVERNVDKIHDWKGETGLRRLNHVVSLRNIRCSGSSHGNCQASCQILWKEAWLERIVEHPAKEDMQHDHNVEAKPIKAPNYQFTQNHLVKLKQHSILEPELNTPTQSQRYVCQITNLLKASKPMSRFDIRQDLRPLIFGNISPKGFFLVYLTALFNAMQKLRQGVPYPTMPTTKSSGQTPTTDKDLQPGDKVVVLSKEAIASTLVRNHNRGMWFGRELVRFCNHRYTVADRVSRIIDESTGEMLALKTPCIILKNVTATGEFLRLCPQNEYAFWREIWLDRVG